jgi:hypothetical protein
MTEGWRTVDGATSLTGEQAVALIRRRVRDGQLETWLAHDTGRSLAVISNRVRTMVMLLDEPGDPGGHAVDPTAAGSQDGYLLGNGQRDTYDNRDTVLLDAALHAVQHIVEHGEPPEGMAWHSDR